MHHFKDIVEGSGNPKLGMYISQHTGQTLLLLKEKIMLS